jgi:hypothetical protein
MLLSLTGLLLAGWLMRSAWKFYHTIDWEEAPEPSPDLQTMRKKSAELRHIAEVLSEAQAAGKLSQRLVEEFTRYSDAEIKELETVENAWKNRSKRGMSE